MFSLEHAIATWRQVVSRRKGLLPEDVDELEQHIRDEVAARAARGEVEERAYRDVMAAMGSPDDLEAAYSRVYWSKMQRKGRLAPTLIQEALMIGHHALLALRNMRRSPGYTLINLAGLAVGIACCLFILLFVANEFSWDRYNEHADRIVRVAMHIPARGETIDVTPTAIAPMAKRSLADVENVARYYDISRYRKVTIRVGDEAWQESGFAYADSTIFDVFTWPFLEGNPREALVRPRTLVVTRSTAERYWGTSRGVTGRTVLVGDREYEVTGVIEDIPHQSHLRFDVLASFASTSWASQEIFGSANFFTYLLLSRGTTVEKTQAEVDQLVAQALEEAGGFPIDIRFILQPLTDIYLVHMGRMDQVVLFIGLALLVLVVAAFNYINLGTARSARRAREVGVRKVLGADNRGIARQFFGESALMTLIAFAAGLAIALTSLPAFESLAGRPLNTALLTAPRMLLWIPVVLASVALAAGFYPALVMTRYEPASTLKGAQSSPGGSARFRDVLVSLQFAITVFLLVSATAVYMQMEHIRTVDTGFDRDQTVVIPLADVSARRAVPTLKDEWMQDSRILGASAMAAIPGNMLGGYGLRFPGMSPDADVKPIHASPVDSDGPEVLGLDFLAGETFRDSPNPLAGPDSAAYEYVINESLARLAGWSPEEAIGQRMSVSGTTRMGTVRGVVRDFNFLDLRQEIEPQALFVEPEWNVLLIRLAPGAPVRDIIGAIQQSWTAATQGSPWTYTFLDDEFNAHYDSEERLGRIFLVASLLAAFVALLGLTGLAAFAAEQRVREIGIRKVLGATRAQIVLLLGTSTMSRVLTGSIIALPIAAWAMHVWLGRFAYRIDLSVWPFVAALLVCLVVSFATVSLQALRAAGSDPAQTLRSA